MVYLSKQLLYITTNNQFILTILTIHHKDVIKSELWTHGTMHIKMNWAYVSLNFH